MSRPFGGGVAVRTSAAREYAGAVDAALRARTLNGESDS